LILKPDFTATYVQQLVAPLVSNEKAKIMFSLITNVKWKYLFLRSPFANLVDERPGFRRFLAIYLILQSVKKQRKIFFKQTTIRKSN